MVCDRVLSLWGDSQAHRFKNIINSKGSTEKMMSFCPFHLVGTLRKLIKQQMESCMNVCLMSVGETLTL